MAAMGYEYFIDGCNGCHLGYRNGKILAIKNRHVDQMPPIKFQFNLTMFERRYRIKYFKMVAILDIGTKRF